MSRWRSGREVEKRIVRCRGGVKDGEGDRDEGREREVGTVRVGREGLSGGEEEDILVVMVAASEVKTEW